MAHQPKGGMCATCRHARRRCDHLPFERMPVIQRDAGGLVIVRCTAHKRALEAHLEEHR